MGLIRAALKGIPVREACESALDLAYHDVRRGRGESYGLQRSGAVDRVVRDLDIFEAKSVPPHGHPPI
jgi:proteasome accessory factor A